MNSTNLISQTRESISSSLAAGLHAMRKPAPMKLSDWSERHFYLSTESSYVEGPWRCLSYQREPMNVIGNDDVHENWFIKGARVGYTKMIMAASQYLAAHKRRNGAIWQPTDADRDEFVKTEIEPAIRDNPELIRIFPAFEKKSKHNTLALKQFIGAALHLRGGKAAKNYRRLTVDYVMIDEIDGFDQNIEGEGPPYQLAMRRVKGANFPKGVFGSTPFTKGMSMIEDGEARCDVRLRWHIPCPHCDHMQEVRWGGKDQSGGIKWDGDSPGEASATARYECESCGESMTHKEYARLAPKHGRWMTEDQSVWVEGGRFYDANGLLPEQPRTVGWKIWAGMNELLPWGEIVREWLTVKGERKLLQGFVNLTLAEAWEEDAVEQMDHQVMHRNRREHYEWEVPEEVNAVTFGVDVQDDRFEFGFCGWGQGEELWHLTYDILQGDPARPDIWKKLEQSLRREFRQKDGTIMRPVIGCIDHGGHYSDEVNALSKRMGPLFVVPAKGRSTYGNALVDMPRKRNKNGIYLAMVGTDTAKNLLYQRLLIEEPGPGHVHWPRTDDFDEEYFKQFTAEKRIPKWTGGKKRYVWDAEKRRNEPWDVTLLNLVAIHIAQQRFGLLLDEPAPGSDPDAPKPKRKKKPQPSGWMKRGGRGGWMR
jgi:terminase, large subunit